jgi:hypothetical protein
MIRFSIGVCVWMAMVGWPAPAWAAVPVVPTAFWLTAGRLVPTVGGLPLSPRPEPQVIQDDRLQATFTVGADQHGRTVLGVDAPEMRVRKTMDADATTLELTGRGRDHVTLTVRSDRFTVTRGRRSVSLVLPVTDEALGRVQQLLAGSSAVQRFRALAKAGGSTRTDGFFDSIVTSAAILDVLNGDPNAADASVARATARGKVKVRQATWQGPNQCWDVYARDAIVVADAYADCYERTRWYDQLERTGCALVYLVRSELAFSWYVSCSGGFFAR